jgi:hypothetical protein
MFDSHPEAIFAAIIPPRLSFAFTLRNPKFDSEEGKESTFPGMHVAPAGCRK